MAFVPVKTPEQQSVMMLHRVRLMLNLLISLRAGPGVSTEK